MSARILIADDDFDNRTIARAILEASGYAVSEARDGAEALEMIEADPPDALLLDLSMPKVTGWDVARRLKAGAHAKLPIIAFTAHAIVGDELKAKADGCDDYLSKPCAPSDIITKVRKWTEASHG